MPDVFRCLGCGSSIAGWPPELMCLQCGRVVQVQDRVLIFTDNPNVDLDGDQTYVGYDPVADGYDRYVYPESLADQINTGYGKTIAGLLSPGSTIADIGCGPGGYEPEIARAGAKIVAGDISLNMLKILAGRLDDGPDRSIIPCKINAYDLPLLDHSMDAAVCLQMLPFVGDPAAVVREIKRVLRPGGLFITDGPKNRRYPDAIPTIRRHYGEALKNQGMTELAILGWNGGGANEAASQFFRHRKVIDSANLVFRFEQTAGWFFTALSSRYTMYQAVIDLEKHEVAIDELRNRLVSEFGPDLDAISDECQWTDSLVVYND